MPWRCPLEFRRRVLDLVASGRSVASIAANLVVSDQTIQAWRRQPLIDTRVEPGLFSVEAAELRTAKRRIAAVETEAAVTRGRAAPISGRMRAGQSIRIPHGGAVGRTSVLLSLVGTRQGGASLRPPAPLVGPVGRGHLIAYRADSGDEVLSGHAQTPQEPHTPPRNDAK